MNPGGTAFIVSSNKYGAWLTKRSWENFIPYFEHKGYTCLTPEWPYRDKSVEELRASTPPELAEIGVTELTEASGAPAWKSIPSWFVFGELDKIIPAAVHRFMAERAGAREVVEIKGASHAVGVSQPEAVAEMILRALKAVEQPINKAQMA